MSATELLVRAKLLIKEAQLFDQCLYDFDPTIQDDIDAFLKEVDEVMDGHEKLAGDGGEALTLGG